MKEDVSRYFAGPVDLDLLYRFAGHSLAERYPLDAAWHPGDIAWEYFTDGINPPRNPERDIRLWFRSGEVAAVAWFYGPDDLCYELRPSLEDEALLREVIAWGEESASTTPFGVRAYDKDTARTQLIAGLGYTRSDRGATIFRRSFAEPVEDAPLPQSFAVRDCTLIDVEKRVESHRDAWSHLDEIGIFGAQSRFSSERYLNVVSSQPYDPTLDIVIEALDGRLVANYICWADKASGIGSYEPVGTGGGFRRRGLARAAILEGARRLKGAGMKWARVSTNLINKPAYAIYRAAGFTVVDEQHLWLKEISRS